MTIACLGWGSLIWYPDDLPIRRASGCGWRKDGPLLPLEFMRKSSDDRMTLVINSEANLDLVPSLWAIMISEKLCCAIEVLRAREKIPIKNIAKHVGRWSSPDKDPCDIPGLSAWASKRDIDHVIWTALPGKESEDEAVSHLKGLEGDTLKKAEEYIRKAPPQIDTAYRKRFESEFGWKPIACDGGSRSD